MFTVRLSYLLCSVLLWNSRLTSAKILEELEYRVQELNTTDHEEVEHFIEQWTSPNRLKDVSFPPLASSLPEIDFSLLHRRQSPYTCTWSNGNGCTGQGALCCGPITDGWCCAAGSTCCQGGGSGCCGGDAFCCGSQTGRDSGDCCKQGQQCCKGGTGKPFCCDSDQTCDNSNRRCFNPSVTVTATSTYWQTETEVATVTTEGVTTEAKVSTRTTTIYVTLSSNTLQTDDPYTETGTLHAGKRFITDFPSPTNSAEHLEIRHEGGPSPRAFNIRPVPSLNALANALARRGVAIERRATATITATATVTATTTITSTYTSTDWSTKWTTSTEVVTKTVAVMVNSKGDSTITVVSGATGASSSDEEPSSKKGTSKGAIIGGAVGGAVGLIILLLIIGFCWRRHNKKKQVDALPPVAQTGGNTQNYVAGSPATKPPYGPPGGYGVQEVRHENMGNYGTPIPPAYSSPPPELAATPITRHSGISSSSPPPGGYHYEMPGTQQQYPPQELYHQNYMHGLNHQELGPSRH